MKKSFLFFISVILFFAFLNTVNASRDFIFEGEYVEYDVSFWGIQLGKIKISTMYDTKFDDVRFHSMKAHFKADEDIPFVDLDIKFNTWMDTTVSYTKEFLAENLVKDRDWDTERYKFDFDKNVINSTTKVMDSVVDSRVIKTMQKWVDGLALYFYARRYVDEKKEIVVPTIMNADTSTTWFKFGQYIEPVEIDAVDYDISTVYFEGKAFWKGLYGMSGEFEGWFSNDEASIPILSKMSVYIGSVRIELVKWKRKGWKPPKY